VTAAVPILRVEGLCKSYPTRGIRNAGSVMAVDDVSFSLAAGGALSIVGESGSGKTTIAKMLVGLERPSAGSILFEGAPRSASNRAAARRRRGREIQIVFQDPYTSLDRHQRTAHCIAEVVALHTRQPRSRCTQRVRELADLVGLDDRQLRALPSALSGGQRQRVSIARALAAEPKVLVLDESVAALDVSIQAQILNLLADIRERTGISYVLISHDLAVVRQLTEETIVLRAGRVVERGPTPTVLDHPSTEYTRVLRDSVPRPGWKPVARPSPPT
jgi:ABC-type glutathione transport system ATPase component